MTQRLEEEGGEYYYMRKRPEDVVCPVSLWEQEEDYHSGRDIGGGKGLFLLGGGRSVVMS